MSKYAMMTFDVWIKRANRGELDKLENDLETTVPNYVKNGFQDEYLKDLWRVK